MAYSLKRTDQSVGHALCRIADEQIAKAVAAADLSDRAEAVHAVRTRCKRLRGLIRLVRPVFANYGEENADFRETAMIIGGARDSKVMIATCDLLTGATEQPSVAAIRRRLSDERRAQERGDVDALLAAARERLLAARERTGSWQLTEDGWSAIEGGLRQTYRRARRLAAKVRAGADEATVHDLRKDIKYHWFHCQLLEGPWPEMMRARRDLATRLADMLGQHHDLAVLADRLAAQPDAFGSPGEVEAAIGLARARQQGLEDEAIPLIGRLLAQSSKAFGTHLAVLWRLWREEG